MMNTPTHGVYDHCVGTSRLFEYGETNKKMCLPSRPRILLFTIPLISGRGRGRDVCSVFLVRSKMRGCTFARARVCSCMRNPLSPLFFSFYCRLSLSENTSSRCFEISIRVYSCYLSHTCKHTERDSNA